jgi:hypothetical protein
VVADAPLTGAGSDFTGGWSTVALPVIPLANNVGAFGWAKQNADELPAGEVLGSIP